MGTWGGTHGRVWDCGWPRDTCRAGLWPKPPLAAPEPLRHGSGLAASSGSRAAGKPKPTGEQTKGGKCLTGRGWRRRVPVPMRSEHGKAPPWAAPAPGLAPRGCCCPSEPGGADGMLVGRSRHSRGMLMGCSWHRAVGCSWHSRGMLMGCSWHSHGVLGTPSYGVLAGHWWHTTVGCLWGARGTATAHS